MAQSRLVDAANGKIRLLFARDVALFPGATAGGAALLAAAPPDVALSPAQKRRDEEFLEVDLPGEGAAQGPQDGHPRDRLFDPGTGMTASAGQAARPSAILPQGSGYGLAALGILPGIIPFLVMQSLVPVLRNGLDLWLDSLLPVIGISVIAAAIIAFGLVGRRPWYIRFMHTFGWVILAAYALGAGLGLLVLVGLVPRTPDLRFFNVVNMVGWVIVSPLAWLVLRMLRLRYWQPGTEPDGNERPEGGVRPRTLLTAWIGRNR